MVKMASNYRSLSDICSTAPHQNYICNFPDKKMKIYKQKNGTKFMQKNDLRPISESKSIYQKKKKIDSIKYQLTGRTN